ncbi:MAG: hypothetical protein HDR00_09415 [Lachnospiraceae bacterium]|nr:hypothetical protein [Lachnospiraceae bacterium]
MEVIELYRIVKDSYGYKIKNMSMDVEEKCVAGLLYDSFFLECNINDQYGRFGAGIEGNLYPITDFLGEHCSLNSDERSIRRSLRKIDRYCTKQLPDKFLDAYNRAYVGGFASYVMRLCRKIGN